MKTVSLQLAQELRKAGYPQEKCNGYYRVRDNQTNLYRETELCCIEGWRDCYNERPFRICAAPTADEILDMLPARIDGAELAIFKYSKGYSIGYYISDREGWKYALREGCLADAAAKMWLYLKEKCLL